MAISQSLINRIAFSLFRKLFAKNITDRYNIEQVLEHPWITRIQTNIPLTFEEDIIKEEQESQFKSIIIILIILSSTSSNLKVKEEYCKKVKSNS